MKAFLILEDGTVFQGHSIGSSKETISEIVFTTSMTGYLEVLTDPSFVDQTVVMTYPLIGNYGICYDDMESLKAWPSGLIAREFSRIPSNFRSTDTIQNFLEKNHITGLYGIDTRALTKMLREKGTMNGMITTDEHHDLQEILPRIKAFKAEKAIEKVTCHERSTIQGEKRKIALMDFGVKKSIIRCLKERGCEITIFPADTKAEEIFAYDPDGIMLSNGPGDPKEYPEIIGELKKLLEKDIPIFAVCIGHQLLAVAAGAGTHKMKYGHRGENHPVKDMETGKVYISSQSHGYVVDESTLDLSIMKPLFKNVNDKTIEGLIYTDKKIFTVQFHPEACGGPQETEYLFDRFLDMIDGGKVNA